ncbi:response regulator [uncultured Cohaesibacter sp.]|uniref:response regulator n=1 Tax=uncultured Cohaesibacter sp. TaxID=1002546 RepID=UPI0029C7E2B8|nr:response regulator [uncultured Cohaesibacter sp.]
MPNLTVHEPDHSNHMMQTRSKPKVLIVDDDRDLLDLIGLFVEVEGYETELVTDGEAALEAIRKDAPDLMILDLVMPGMSGFDVLAKLHSLLPHLNLPVVMVTANEERAMHVQALQSGVVDYIHKPIDFAVLSARIRAALLERRIQDKLAEANARLEAILATRTRQLEVQNNYLTAVLDMAQDGVIGCDADGFPAICNEKASEMLGIEDSLRMLIPALACNENEPDDGEAPISSKVHPLKMAYENGTLEATDFILGQDEETVKVVNATGGAVHDKDGSRIGAVISLRDVTEQRRLEQNAENGRQRYEKLLVSVPMPLHVTDRNGLVLEANDLWLRAFGYDRQQVLGASLGAFLTTEFQHLASEPARVSLINMGHAQDVKCRIRHADGHKVAVKLVSQAIYDEKGDLSQILEYITQMDE